MAKKPIEEGGEDGKESHPELSISSEALLLQPALQKMISNLIWSEVVNSALKKHFLLSLFQTMAPQSKESTQHKHLPFQQRPFRRAAQCKVCSSCCHKLAFS